MSQPSTPGPPGYHTRGTLTVTIPPTAAAVMALAADSGNGRGLPGKPGGPSLVDRIVDATGLHVAEPVVDDDGTIILFLLEGETFQEWTDRLEYLLRWVVEHGGGLQGTVIGEDDYTWTYNITPGDNFYTTEQHWTRFWHQR